MQQKIGFVAGAFDFVHAGHVKLFEECKKRCDYLIVGLQTDPSLSVIPLKEFTHRKKQKPIMSLEERYQMIRGNRWVDAVLIYTTEEELIALEKWLPVDFRFTGTENKGKPHYFTRGKFVVVEGDQRVHSSEIRRRVWQQHL